jgi:hypothetical protein
VRGHGSRQRIVRQQQQQQQGSDSNKGNKKRKLLGCCLARSCLEIQHMTVAADTALPASSSSKHSSNKAPVLSQWRKRPCWLMAAVQIWCATMAAVTALPPGSSSST